MTKRKLTAPKTQGTLCSVILYENSAARRRALKFWHHLEQEHSRRNNLVVNWYAFGVLSRGNDAGRAAQKAARADFIVFAVSYDGDLPDDIKLWIESWLGKRQDREGAVIGLVEGGQNGLGRTASFKEIYLRQIAHRAGMDYLSQTPQATAKTLPDYSFDSVRARAGQMTSVMDQILHTHTAPRM